MKAKNFILSALCATVLAAAGCKGLEPYSINAPADLAEKIAAYKAEKEGERTLPEGAEEIDITEAVVGAEDNTSPWWQVFSQYFTIPVEKKLVVKFTNYSGAANYNNWVAAITTPFERGASGYAEYFVLRSDKYGWGNAEFNIDNVLLDIDGEAPTGDSWWAEKFLPKMNQASFTMTLDHASEGRVYITAEGTALDGSIITETYDQAVSFVDDINLFFVADGAHIKLEQVYIAPSDYPVAPDSQPVKVTVTGYPAAIPFDAEEKDFWGNATATVTFEDGSTTDVSKDDLNIIAPDASTPGSKIVVVTYSKTKKGASASKAAAGAYTVELVASLNGISVASAPVYTTYYYLNNTELTFQTYGFALQADFGSSTADIALNDPALTISPIVLAEGAQDITFTYQPGAVAKSCTQGITLVKGREDVGLPNLSSDFLSDQSSLTAVASGESQSVEFVSYSGGAEFFHAPSVIIRKAVLGASEKEYAICRLDNFGWLNGDFDNQKIADSDKSSDWNWDLLKQMINYSHYTLTVTNNGSDANGGVKVRFDATWPNGDKHYQEYTIRPADYSDISFCLTVDHCYLVVK